MAHRVHRQLAARHDLVFFGAFSALRLSIPAAQYSANSLDQEALGEGFADVIIRAHTQTQNLVDLFVF